MRGRGVLGNRATRWGTGVVTGVVLVLGGVQVLHGQSLGWAAMTSAVLMFAGPAFWAGPARKDP